MTSVGEQLLRVTIGTRGHGAVTRRLLSATKRRAELSAA